jgi:hypothetical protein
MSSLRKEYDVRMSRKEGGDAAAVSLAEKRWRQTPEKERQAHARMMNEVRWAGHEAKRPASSRKPAKEKKAR